MRIALILIITLLAAACGGDDPTIEGATESPADRSDQQRQPADGETTPEIEDGGPVEPLAEFELQLTGAAEVPGPGADGSADAELRVDPGQICTTIETDGVGEVTDGHIHEGAVDSSGTVAVDLQITIANDGEFDRCIDVDQDVIDAILDDPAQYYLNLHTAEFPAGAVRAQLDAPDADGI